MVASEFDNAAVVVRDWGFSLMIVPCYHVLRRQRENTSLIVLPR